MPQAGEGPDPTPRSDGRYETLLQNMTEGFALCEAMRDNRGRVVDYWLRFANAAFVERSPPGGAQIGKRQREMRPRTSAAWFAACERALAGEPVRFECEDRATGRWYEVHMMRMSDVEFGQLFVDVGVRKAAEQRQAELFAELNHRVKNNLAVVAAALQLQARDSRSELREGLSAAADRILSVADLHAALHQQNSADTVDLRPYLQALGARLAKTLLAGRAIRLTVACAPLPVSVADAVNIGLVTNELVTNAAKHAFSGGRSGTISVALVAEPGQIRLTVSDDGVGAPAAAREKPGLGLRLVRSLVEGVGGSIAFKEGKGSRIEVVKPLEGDRSLTGTTSRQQPLL
ncbi:MAG: signal transduction histidine kinase [Phenylobacterium sp.]|nr:signal transduction histidine kinase [Phenylobacterium sp.]